MQFCRYTFRPIYANATFLEEESGGHFQSENVERADIFKTSMENNFLVGSVLVDAIIAGTF